MATSQIYFPPEDVFMPARKAVLGDSLEADTTPIQFELTNEFSDAQQIMTALADFAYQYGMNQDLRAFIISILPQGLRQDDRKNQVQAVVDFMSQYVTYVRDPNGLEYVQSSMQFVKQICQGGQATGDCDDHVLFFNSALNTMGFQTRVNAIKTNGSEFYNHVFSSLKNGDKWVDYDLCVKGAPLQDYSGFERIYADS